MRTVDLDHLGGRIRKVLAIEREKGKLLEPVRTTLDGFLDSCSRG